MSRPFKIVATSLCWLILPALLGLALQNVQPGAHKLVQKQAIQDGLDGVEETENEAAQAIELKLPDWIKPLKFSSESETASGRYTCTWMAQGIAGPPIYLLKRNLRL